MNFKYPQVKFDAAGQAKYQEQKRQMEKDIELKNKSIPVFMFQGYGFRLQHHAHLGGVYFEGPLCPNRDTKGDICFSILSVEPGGKDVICKACEFTGKLPIPLEEFKEKARIKYEGRQRFLESGGNIQTLDVPYEAIKQQGKDKTREIKIKWSQKDGRNMAIIYFIDREENKDGKKAHMFVDFDREELRHDAIDENPANVIALIKAEFPNTSVKVEYKDKK